MRLALALAVLLAPGLGSAQTSPAGVTLFDPTPTEGVFGCSSDDAEPEGAWATLLSARQLEQEEARRGLSALQDSLATHALASPDDVELQYLYAVVMGSRADVESRGAKVRAAAALHEQTLKVLELDPHHPGAQHLMGRLHAAVMRLNPVMRFIAVRLLGGGALSGASWEEARLRLEAAAVGDPCVPDHHYELAKLYAERGDPSAAVDRLEALLQLSESRPAYADVAAKGRELLQELNKGG